MGAGEHQVAAHEVRIDLDGLLAHAPGGLKIGFVSGNDVVVGHVPAFQVIFVGFGAPWSVGLGRIQNSGCEVHLQLGGDGLGDLLLDAEDVGQFTVIKVRPEMGVIHGADQLDVDPDRLFDFFAHSLPEYGPLPVRGRSPGDFFPCPDSASPRCARSPSSPGSCRAG